MADFRRLLFVCLLLVLCVVGALAQVPVVPVVADPNAAPPVPLPQPKYVISLGVGISNNEKPHFSGIGTFAYRTANNLYTEATVEQRGGIASTRGGVIYELAQSKDCVLFGLADAGMAASAAGLGAALSTGGGVACKLDRITKALPSTRFWATARLTKLNATDPALPQDKTGINLMFGLSHEFN